MCTMLLPKHHRAAPLATAKPSTRFQMSLKLNSPPLDLEETPQSLKKTQASNLTGQHIYVCVYIYIYKFKKKIKNLQQI